MPAGQICRSSTCVWTVRECAYVLPVWTLCKTAATRTKRQISHVELITTHTLVLFILSVFSQRHAVRAGRSSSPSVHQMSRWCRAAPVTQLRLYHHHSGSGARCSPHLSVGQVDAPADLQAVLSGQVHAKEELSLQLQSAAWYKVNASSCRLGPTTRRPAAGQSAAGTGSRAHLQRMEGRQIVVTSLFDY